eukprot:GHVU01150793.1.p1 GENE.GHVU01150793.1~~GHVU01150793.1.p1  ORF type:complete len:123 (+),score=0.46 GHVU01150793.1:528-896(+)
MRVALSLLLQLLYHVRVCVYRRCEHRRLRLGLRRSGLLLELLSVFPRCLLALTELPFRVCTAFRLGECTNHGARTWGVGSRAGSLHIERQGVELHSRIDSTKSPAWDPTITLASRSYDAHRR